MTAKKVRNSEVIMREVEECSKKLRDLKDELQVELKKNPLKIENEADLNKVNSTARKERMASFKKPEQRPAQVAQKPPMPLVGE